MRTILVLVLVVLIAGCVTTTKRPAQEMWTYQCAYSYMDFRGQFRCNPKTAMKEEMDIITVLTFFEKKRPTPGEGTCSALALVSAQTVGSKDWFRRDKLEFNAEDTHQIMYGQNGEIEIKFNSLWLVCRKM